MNTILVLITTACFILSSVCGEALAALTAGGPARALDAPAVHELIPADAGRITGQLLFDNSPLVIHIQDLHCHGGVQRNIARILGALDARHSLQQVYVEGGYGAIDTSWINAISDDKARAQIREELVDAGRLSGAEYYAMTTGRFTLLHGMEDARLHKQNIIRLGDILKLQPRFNACVLKCSRELEMLKRRHWSMHNRRLDRTVTAYRAGRLTPARYYRALEKYIAKINDRPADYTNPYPLRLEHYPAIAASLEMDGLKRRVNTSRAHHQLQAFVCELKGTLPYRDYLSLLADTHNLTDVAALYAKARALNPQLLLNAQQRYPDLFRYFRLTELSRKINPVELISQERQLVEDLRFAFSGSAAELDTSFLADFFGTFSDYLSARLSAEEYAYFKARSEKFKRVWARHASGRSMETIAPYLAELDEYYAVNERRNEVFVRSLFPQSHADLTGREVIVLVAGGFHSEGLARLFAQRRISYVSVTPGAGPTDSRYAKVFNEQAVRQARLFSSEALALTLRSCLPHTKVLEAGPDNIVLELDGTGDLLTFKPVDGTWRLITDTDHQSAADAFITSDAAQDITAAVNEAVALAAAVAPDRIGFVVETINALVNALGRWGAHRALWGGNGLIWRIATDEKVYAHLRDRIDAIAQLPYLLQDAALYDAHKQLEIRRLSGPGAALAPLFEIPCVYELWQAVQGGPIDATHDARRDGRSSLSWKRVNRHLQRYVHSLERGSPEPAREYFKFLSREPIAEDGDAQRVFEGLLKQAVPTIDRWWAASTYLYGLSVIFLHPSLPALRANPENRSRMKDILERCIEMFVQERVLLDAAEISALGAALSVVGDRQSVKGLLGLMRFNRDDHDYMRTLAVTAARLDPAYASRQWIASVRAFVDGPDPDAATDDVVDPRVAVLALSAAAQAGIRIDARNIIPVLTAVMNGNAPLAMRAFAAQALYALQPSAHAQSVLRTMLRSADVRVTEAALTALGTRRDPQYILEIIRRRHGEISEDIGAMLLSLIADGRVAEMCAAATEMAETDIDAEYAVAPAVYNWGIKVCAATRDAGARREIIILLRTLADNARVYQRPMRITAPDHAVAELVAYAIKAGGDSALPEQDRLNALQVAADMDHPAAYAANGRALSAVAGNKDAPLPLRRQAAVLLGKSGGANHEFFFQLARKQDSAERACGIAGMAALAETISQDFQLPDDIRAMLGELARTRNRDRSMDRDIAVLLSAAETTETRVKQDIMQKHPDPQVRIAAINAIGAMQPRLAVSAIKPLAEMAVRDANTAVRRAAVSALIALMSKDDGTVTETLKDFQTRKGLLYPKIANAVVASGNEDSIAGVIKCFVSVGIADPAVMNALQIIMGKVSVGNRSALNRFTDVILPYLKSTDALTVFAAENIISCAADDPEVLAAVVALGADASSLTTVLHVFCLSEIIRPGITEPYAARLREIYASSTDTQVKRLAAVLLAHQISDAAPPATDRAWLAGVVKWASNVFSRLIRHDRGGGSDDMFVAESRAALTGNNQGVLSLILPLLEPVMSHIISSAAPSEVEAVVDHLSQIVEHPQPGQGINLRKVAAQILLRLAAEVENPRHPVLVDLKMFAGISGNPYLNNEPQKVIYVRTVAAPLLRRLGYGAAPKEISSLMKRLARLQRDISLADGGADLKIFLHEGFRTAVSSKLKDVHPAYETLYENEIGLYGLAIAVARTLSRYGMPDTDESIEKAVNMICENITEQWDRPVLDSDTVFCSVSHDENSYLSFGVRGMLNLMANSGIVSPKSIIIRKADATAVLKDIFSVLTQSGEKKIFIHLRGHGNHREFWLSDTEFLSVSDMAHMLENARKNGVDLSNITLVMDCCYSHDFAVALYNAVAQSLHGESVSGLPLIITSANKSSLGFRRSAVQLSEWEIGLSWLIRLNNVSRSGAVTVGDVIQAGVQYTYLVDSTIFSPHASDMVASMTVVEHGVTEQLEADMPDTAQGLAAGTIGKDFVPLDASIPVLEVNMKPGHLSRILAGAASALGLAAVLWFVGTPLVVLPAGFAAAGIVLAAISPIAGLELIRLAVWAGTRAGFFHGAARGASIDLGGGLSLVPGAADESHAPTAFVTADPDAAVIRIKPSHFSVLSALNARPLTRALMKLSLYMTGTIGHEVYHLRNPVGGEQRAFAYGQILPAIAGFLLVAGGSLLLGFAGVPALLAGVFIGAPVGVGVVGILLKSALRGRARAVSDVTIAWVSAEEQSAMDDTVLTPTMMDGSVVCPVRVTAVRPQGWDATRTDIVNLGTTEQGATIWGGLDNGQVVVYSEDADRAAIAAVVNSRLKDDRPVQSRLRALLSAAGARAGLDFSHASFSDGVYCQPQQQPGRASRAYDRHGNVILTLDTTDSRQFASAVMSARAVRSGDSYAMARSVLLYLDTAFDPERNIQTVLNMRGQQILVDGVGKAQAVRELLDAYERAHRISLGIRVFALTGEAPADEARMQGLAGYVLHGKDSMTLFDADTPRTGLAAGMIHADTADAIETALRDARYPVRILNVGDITQAVVNGRDFLDKAGLTHLLGAGIRAFFGRPMYSERYVRDAVYGFDRDAFARQETAAQYLADMKLSVDPAVYARVAAVFTSAVEERSLAEAWLRENPSVGAMPVAHKQMLGRALSLSGSRPIQKQEITAYVTEGQIDEAYRAMMSASDPTAIGTLIALIQAFDLQSPVIDPDHFRMEPADTARIAAILSAA